MSTAGAAALRIACNRWARYMLGPRPADKTWLEHLRTCNARVARARRVHELPDWPTRALRASHGWHGHLARSGAGPHRTLAWKTWDWRSEGWWRTIQAMRQGETTRDQETTHPRRGVLRHHAEHGHCIVFGWDWAARATNRKNWSIDRDTFVHNSLEYFRRGTKRKRLQLDVGLDEAAAHRSLRRRLRRVDEF